MPDYFTLAELRALPPLSDDTIYTDARCEAASDHITAIIEREVGTSFIARTVTDEEHDGGGYVVALRKAHALSVTSATEDGVAVTDDLRIRPGGLLRKFSSSSSYTPLYWTAGSGNVLVTYEAGYSSTPPDDIKEAALRGTRAYLLETNSNARFIDRRTTLTNEQGSGDLAVADEDHPTGYPEVDAVIVGWRRKLNRFGFA